MLSPSDFLYNGLRRDNAAREQEDDRRRPRYGAAKEAPSGAPVIRGWATEENMMRVVAQDIRGEPMEKKFLRIRSALAEEISRAYPGFSKKEFLQEIGMSMLTAEEISELPGMKDDFLELLGKDLAQRAYAEHQRRLSDAFRNFGKGVGGFKNK